MDNDKLIESICNFSLDDGPRGNQGYSRVLMQLFGYMGHGKSSFINSCRYVINDEENFVKYAIAGGVGVKEGGAVTITRQAYELTENIFIVDNRGFFRMTKFERAEIYAQLGGFIPVDEEVEWPNNYLDMMTKLENAALNPNYTDFIVPILVYSIEMLLDNTNDEEVKEFMKNCVKITGIVPIVVITNKSKGDFIELEKVFKLMGAEVVISIENYTEEDQIKTQGRTNDILMIIHKALTNVKFRLGQERNFQVNWVKRKKFLLKYVHEADLEKKEDDKKREEEKKRIWEEKTKREEEEEKIRDEEIQKEPQEKNPKKPQGKNPKKQGKNHCLIV